MAALSTIAGLAALGGGIAGALDDGGESESSTANFTRFNPADLASINSARGDLRRGVSGFQNLAGQAENRFGRALGDFEAGRLGSRERGLLSQLTDRNRRLQSARQQSLASRFGPGSKLTGILGAQGQLQGDLNLNRANFDVAQQQAGNLGTLQSGLGSLLNFRGTGLDAQRQLLANELSTGKALGTTFGTTQSQATPGLEQRFSSLGRGLRDFSVLTGNRA